MSKTRILIVDDDVRLSNTLKFSLQESGPYEVRIENNPTRARAAAEDFRPNLILLDVIMPEMDGGTVAAEIRQNKHTKDIPVIFLTSILDKDEAKSKGGRIGDDLVLAKPVSITELISQIEKALERART